MSWDDRLVRSDGAPETRPRKTKCGVGGNQVRLDQPQRLHGFNHADERLLARRVARDGRFDHHARARQHVAAQCRLPIAGGLQLALVSVIEAVQALWLVQSDLIAADTELGLAWAHLGRATGSYEAIVR